MPTMTFKQETNKSNRTMCKHRVYSDDINDTGITRYPAVSVNKLFRATNRTMCAIGGRLSGHNLTCLNKNKVHVSNAPTFSNSIAVNYASSVFHDCTPVLCWEGRFSVG